jgi:hypothetical protein
MPDPTCAVCGQAASGLDPAGRCHACAGHQMTRLQLVADAPSETVALAAAPPPPPRGRDPLVGRELGGCRLLSKIGGGGMGVVYKAEQLSLGRTVAVKLVKTVEGAQEADFIARLRSEARAIAALGHPHIVNVHDVGSDGGLHYIIMELVDGPSLRAMMRAARGLDEARCRAFLLQCLEGLEHAHAKGVIHRDLKPDNILVAHGTQVKLADFGLAKLLHSDQHLTSTGVLLGTPLYMSPEAVRGEPLDARADLYSLGATFYHVLAGSPPFTGDSAMGILYRHMHDPLPPLSTRRPGVDPYLAQVVERLLAKHPGERYATAGEALGALGAAEATLSLVAPAMSAPPSRAHSPGAPPAAAAAGSAVAPGAAATASPRPGTRGRLWLSLALLVGLLLALGPGRRALEGGRRTDPPPGAQHIAEAAARRDGERPAVAAEPAAPPHVPAAPHPGTAAPPSAAQAAAEAELRLRCEKFFGHVARRELRALVDFLPPGRGRPLLAGGIGARLRAVHSLPDIDDVSAFEVLDVSVEPGGDAGRTDVLVRHEDPAVPERRISLPWQHVSGAWRLKPR